MAEAGAHLNKRESSCSMCVDLLKDPVTTPCGHSYCGDCIEDYWVQADNAGVYRCPQCRQTFTPRPVLGRNTMLAEVLEKVKKAEVQAAPPDRCYAGPGDAECDVCIGRKKKAVKSCLVCLASYCETHLQPHYESPTFKKHKLIDATGQLQDKICSLHEKLLEIYCRTDRQRICRACVMDEHRTHDTVSAAAGRTEKQNHLEVTQREFQQREEDMKELRQAVDSLARSAQAALEDTESIFGEMMHSVERRRSEVRDLIGAQEKAAIRWATGLQEQLEQEIAELKRRCSELDKFSTTEDHIEFLQSFQFVCAPPVSGDLPRVTVSPQCSFEDVRKTLSALKDQIEDASKTKLIQISETVQDVDFLKAPEPRTRTQFLQYACQPTLDPNTAHDHLSLSEEHRVATRTTVNQYPHHPDRFNALHQVLCREALCGRSYWEVQWSGRGVDIAVSYRGISRKGRGNNSMFGHNDKSWSLFCSPSGYYFLHSNKRTAVSGPHSSTIGVYLDHRAGTLSFYSVSKDTMTLLHKVQTTFTEPLYPGFWILGSEFGSNFFVKLSSFQCKTDC
ncbi:tripartite motif-containing protein 16-like protein [Scleropages formosus]|uniref:tripartite motif-containing protein 16-like protein n=1 Tax=Scleropages formosus TaxID=113540 RepID=UPI0010FA79F6|nr:tripartite motif-containing protein 16-like protein [Scleropages formosus]